jgi:transposase-like protein
LFKLAGVFLFGPPHVTREGLRWTV